MIISTNRMSTMNGNFVVAANESYGIGDIGQILIEAEHNDMAIFNAILKSDFTEIRARQEGTMLESELSAMTEASAKGLFNTIAVALQRFWTKIKGVFKDAYAKIGQFCAQHGKAYVAAHKKAIDELKKNNTSVTLKKVTLPKDFAKSEFSFGAAEGINVEKLKAADKSASALAGEYFKSAYGSEDKSVYEAIKNHYFQEYEMIKLPVEKLANVLTGGGAAINALRKAEDDVEKSLRNAIKIVKEKGHKTDISDEEAVAYRKAASAITTIISADTRAKVRLSMYLLTQCRVALAKALSEGKKSGKEDKKEEKLAESVENLLAIYEAEEVMNSDASEMAPELAEEVLEIVADAIEKAAEEVGDDPTEDPASEEDPAED